MKYTEEEKNILRHIGFYYCYEYSKDRNKAVADLSLLYITNLSYNDNVITITLGRPGLLIGSYGKNIEALQKYFSEKLGKNIKINIVENNIMDYLMGFNTMWDDE